ncbi:MAG: HD-GYP domain-containing protein [Stenotrophomonas sp.]
MALALDGRDRYTDNHCQRIARIALALGQRCEPPGERLAHLPLAARFHDVGKIGIRDNGLLHPGRLCEEQMELMRTHPERGAPLFAATGRRDADAVARLIRHHHEAYDGSGYPVRWEAGQMRWKPASPTAMTRAPPSARQGPPA